MADKGVALLGGAFNPIHNGHLIIARSVAELLDLPRVILIPSAHPPHKSEHDLADAGHRLEMTRLAVADEPRLEVIDIEIQRSCAPSRDRSRCNNSPPEPVSPEQQQSPHAHRSGPSYTILTVEAYRKSLGPDVTIHWIIGGDTLPELHTWYRVSELVDLCRIVTAVRPGFESPDLSPLAASLSPQQIERLRNGILLTPRIDISATDIRRRVRHSQSIRYLVPEPVRDYISAQSLYRAD